MLIGYFFPADPTGAGRGVLPDLIAVLGGVGGGHGIHLVTPTAGALLKVILVTGTVVGVVASAQGQTT